MWAQFLDTRHHWHQYRDPHAADLIQHTLQHQLQETQHLAREEVTLQYKLHHRRPQTVSLELATSRAGRQM